MWPWGHLSLGYLVYSLGCRLFRRPVVGGQVLWLAFGTQVPDLVDKPLTWYLDVLPGRSLGHSALVAAVVAAATLTVAARLNRRPSATAFVVGYLTHLVGDALGPLAKGWYGGLSFLAWPVLEAPAYRGPDSLLGHVRRLLRLHGPLDDISAAALTSLFWLEFLMLGVVLAIWIHDGMPGPGALRRFIRRLTGRE